MGPERREYLLSILNESRPDWSHGPVWHVPIRNKWVDRNEGVDPSRPYEIPKVTFRLNQGRLELLGKDGELLEGPLDATWVEAEGYVIDANPPHPLLIGRPAPLKRGKRDE